MPERIYCEAFSVNPKWEGEDEVILTLGYEGGRFAAIRMSWNTRLKEAEWDGKGKMLSSSDILYERYIQGSQKTLYLKDETELFCNGTLIEKDEGTLSNFARQYLYFTECVETGREPMCSGKKITDVIRVQEAALESARIHRVVML